MSPQRIRATLRELALREWQRYYKVYTTVQAPDSTTIARARWWSHVYCQLGGDSETSTSEVLEWLYRWYQQHATRAENFRMRGEDWQSEANNRDAAWTCINALERAIKKLQAQEQHELAQEEATLLEVHYPLEENTCSS